MTISLPANQQLGSVRQNQQMAVGEYAHSVNICLLSLDAQFYA